MPQTQAPTFGDLLKQLRKRGGMTQGDLAAAVGYSVSFVSVLEQNRRLPDVDAVLQVFIPALGLLDEPHLATRLVELAASARGERSPVAITRQRETQIVVTDVRGEQTPHLPAAPTDLIGRAQDVRQLCQRLPGHSGRLLTLVGPPGIGKTQLALAVAAQLHYHYPDGAAFVALAAVGDAVVMATTIAASVGCGDASPKPPKDKLIEHLRNKTMLLVLDNLEQIRDGAPLIAEMLAACPGLCILATSRERLHLRAEQRFQVPPLDLAPAIELFVQRAQAVNADFRLTPQNQPTLATICQRLDRLPLALELCAAQIDLLAPAQLLARLHDRRLDLLVEGAHDLPPRQRTLRAAIQHSYRLLDEAERRLFRRLGAFVGGFDLPAVAAVGADSTATAARPPTATLHALIGKSLVRAETLPSSEQRFAMLETIREYALERLREAGEEVEMGHRHAAYLLELVETVVPKLGGPEMRKALEQLETELPNLRAAFAWFEKVANHDLALRFAAALLPFWVNCGPHEGRAMLQTALSRPGAGPPIIRARALSALGRLSYMESDYWPETVTILEESLASFRALDDLDGSAEVLDHLNLVASQRGDMEQAMVFVEASLRDSRAAHNLERTAWALLNLADLVFVYGDDARGNVLLDESLELFDELKHSTGHAYGLLVRAWEIQRRGDGPQAVALFTESVGLLRETGQTGLLAMALMCLGRAVLNEGDHARAVSLLEESLAVHRQVNGLESDPLVLHTLGEAALIYGDHAAARAHFRESQALCRKLGNTWHSAGALLGEGHVACAEGDTGAANKRYTEALTIFAGLPSWDDRRRRTGIAACLASLAGAAAHTLPERATRLYGAAATLRATVGQIALAYDDSPYRLPSNRSAAERGLDTAHAISTVDKRGLDTAHAALSEAAFQAAWDAGQALTLEQIVDEVLTLSPTG